MNDKKESKKKKTNNSTRIIKTSKDNKNTKTSKITKPKTKVKIKPRQQTNATSKTSSKSKNNTPSSKNIKARVQKKDTKQDKNAKLICTVALIFIVILFYFIFDWFFALITALGIGLIIGFAQLAKKCRGKKSGKILKILLILCLILAIIGVSGFTAFMMYVKKVADPIYDTTKLETPENTTFLDIYNIEYAKLGTEIRQKVTYDELPQVLIDAIIATEDSRFYQHNGFDAPRFMKAALGQIMGNSDAGGASTITMQVVKNTFSVVEDENGNMVIASSGIEGIARKFQDIYLSIFKLEKQATKEKIIEYYVNNHYLGGNIYGVQEAAEAYFGKNVSELNLSEAAIIAGMFKSPAYYRPTTYPEHAEDRRAVVLYLMKRHGYITAEEEAMANSIPVDSLVSNGTSTSNNKYQGYIDTVVDEIEDKYGINAYTTPLLVYTNLDRTKQDAVNSVMNGESYTWIDDKVQAGVSVLDSKTGKILAIGNGRNVDGRTASTLDQLNYATEITRQPGSTAKPIFDYGPGIEYNNWSTYTLFDDSAYTYSNGRSIKNWDNGYFGVITMHRALSTSRNIPALKAFQQVNNDKIKEFVTNLGITPEICPSKYSYNKETDLCETKDGDTTKPSKLHEAHSIGSFEPGTNPLEMSAAYAAFSNGGTYNEPYSVSKIVFKSTGEEIVHEENSNQAMSDATAFMITKMLEDVALTGGTPKNVACKTGTTNFDSNTMQSENLPYDAIRDSWLVGYSTKTVIALWYGYNDIDSGVLHNVPATIQKDYIFKALINAGAMESNREAFVQPSSVSKVAVVAGSDPPKLPGAYTGEVVYEYFKKGYEPDEVYEIEKLDKPQNFKATYNKTTKKVTLTWDKVDQGNTADKNYGTFGYNIYLGSTLIGFTEKTTYTYTPKDTPYGTYKVIAAYKGYSEIQSEEATYKLEEKTEEEIIKEKLKLSYTGSTEIPKDSALKLDLTKFTVKYDNKVVTAKIKSCNPTQITVPGKAYILCTVNYKDEDYALSTAIETTKAKDETPVETPEEDDKKDEEDNSTNNESSTTE